MEYVVKIIADVLAALYQTAGASLLLAALVMCVYMLGRKQGAGPVVRAWIRQFRTSGWFRKHFFLVFYVSMMLFRTLLCRTIWGNPLDHVLGIWSLHNNGELYTENFENLILFLPFIVLLFWAQEERDHYKEKSIQDVLILSFKISFLFSLGIEFCQLFFKLGTFQLADLFFNTVGGLLGGIWYWGFDRSRRKIESAIRRFGGWDVTPWRSADEEQKSSGTYAMTENPSMDRSVSEAMGENATPEIKEDPKERMDSRYRAIERLIREAGKKMVKARPSDAMIHQKEGLANFCTDYDMEIQRFLIKGFSEILPGAAFFGEEDTEGNVGAQADGEFTFYIDPIDGTTNFMFDYHHSCISVGLAHKDQMIAGFVYHPYINDMYIAIRGKGSYLNGKRIQLADKSVTEGIVEFGCARYNEAGIDWLFRVVKDMFQNSLSIRCGGSAALGLCRAASGSNTVYLELKLQPYDYAAASVILEEAGGVITQIDGSPITLHEGCSIIGGTPKAWKESKEDFERLRDSSAEGTTKVKLNK